MVDVVAARASVGLPPHSDDELSMPLYKKEHEERDVYSRLSGKGWVVFVVVTVIRVYLLKYTNILKIIVISHILAHFPAALLGALLDVVVSYNQTKIKEER